MTIFDLVFALAMLVSLGVLAAGLVLLIGGRFRKALRLVGVYSLGAIGYLLVGVAVSFFRPQRVMDPGADWCFDDWCLAVENVTRTPGPAGTEYNVALRIFSRAARVSQRAKGAWIYLIDQRGRLYPPHPDGAAVPLDVLLQPGDSIATSRRFKVPADAHHLGLITGHGGSYCGAMSFLVIGEGACLFRKPSMVRID